MLYLSCVCHALGSVHCCLVVTCWEKADLLVLVCDVNCVIVTFPCGNLGQVWHLIVSLPDLCRFSFLVVCHCSISGRSHSFLSSVCEVTSESALFLPCI